ncbi:MAG: 16S rRNA (guanine(527)-N(7))-methyltransferase RsmG [Dehalococcoidia bacterium]
MLDILSDGARTYGVRLSDAQVRAFRTYFDLLAAWSRRINLVSDASEDAVVRRHFLESVALGAALREREVLRPGADLLDIGAGAGFPGMVLKLVWPGIRLTLLEATAKKARFLETLAEALELPDITVLTGRAEELAHDTTLRGRFDLVVARAVAPLPELLELTLPFARAGGRVVAPKGSRAEEEVAAAKHALEVLGGEAFVVPFRVPGPPQQLVVVVKRRQTPPEYPRRPGVPGKRPL